MLGSLPILFAVLIAVPGVLIPLHVLSRMITVLHDQRRQASDRVFAGGATVAMLLLMGFAVYAALETYTRLSALTALSS